MRTSPGGVDLRPYLGAFGMLAKNPTLVIVPFVVLVGGLMLQLVLGQSAYGPVGSITASLGGLVARIALLWGLGVACVHADMAWRRGRAPFDAAWSEAQRRSRDLLGAAVGVTFVLSLASYAGVILGALGLIVSAAAVFFMIWAIPAAAIGGIPGMAALNASVERARANPVGTAVLTVVCLGVAFLAMLAGQQLAMLALPLIAAAPVAADLIIAFVEAIAMAYAALVMSKTYTDAAFGRRW